MSEHITLRGFVGKDPESHLFEDGTMVARFRLATTSRRFDAASNTWQDGSTNWYTVRCFRTLAMHVMASVRCGHPVVVTGKLGINEWQSETGPRTVVQVDAAAVGHDLSFGTANFSRSGGRAQRTGNAGGAQSRQDTGDGPADGAGGVVRGEDEAGIGGRYRDALSLGLGEGGYVDVTSGAVIAVDADDHTFDGLGAHGDRTDDPGGMRNAGGSDEATAGESSASEDREPAVAAS
ncbi:single-stranded DNA-binding protein [Kocuria sp. KD4]|uniref:single-stranded DNA-binding protein n=1 Tax=Kocuria sp. KD4 TaxID=2719588 RepID=UPI001427783A|nr:single-stranded DNA-binding protein [Kocuria sp. KD4]QIR69613.1 single-stranded DNA-binding protein [Kocuria sp. KD4]